MKAATQRGQKVIDWVCKEMPNFENQCPAHGIDHTISVWKVGMKIGKQENANLEILEPALLLHDIKRYKGEESDKEHAKLSLDFAREILPNFGYDQNEIEQITNVMACHSRDYKGEKSLEGKILYDADKVDGIGKNGIKRMTELGKSREWNIKKSANWYEGRINDILENEMIYTETGKKILNKGLKVSLRWCETNKK